MKLDVLTSNWEFENHMLLTNARPLKSHHSNNANRIVIKMKIVNHKFMQTWNTARERLTVQIMHIIAIKTDLNTKQSINTDSLVVAAANDEFPRLTRLSRGN